MSKKKITIDLDEYRELLINDSILSVLTENGVDNWQGFQYDSEAIEKQVDEIISKKS